MTSEDFKIDVLHQKHGDEVKKRVILIETLRIWQLKHVEQTTVSSKTIMCLHGKHLKVELKSNNYTKIIFVQTQKQNGK
jgi:hypothetical protein